MTSRIVGIIPARMASSRFPGKPLKKICDIPLIGHVYLRSKLSSKLDALYVATCDIEIKKYILNLEGQVVMTSNKHQRASDRIAEALLKIEKIEKKKYNIVVLIQGDEPLITPKMINQSINPLIKNKKIQVANLMQKIKFRNYFIDRNEIKVVYNKKKFALYFSREPIPTDYFNSDKKKFYGYKQVCIIPFRRDMLLKYINIKPTILEKIESIDMNRLLENNIMIKMILTKDETYAVDTKKDLLLVQKIMKNDKYLKKYSKII